MKSYVKPVVVEENGMIEQFALAGASGDGGEDSDIKFQCPKTRHQYQVTFGSLEQCTACENVYFIGVFPWCKGIDGIPLTGK